MYQLLIHQRSPLEADSPCRETFGVLKADTHLTPFITLEPHSNWRGFAFPLYKFTRRDTEDTTTVGHDSYDAPTSKISRSAQKEKCPKTNLKSQCVLCEAYTFIVVNIVYCAQMAHIQGLNVPLHSKTGL